MSVIVKGMTMPESCEDCRFLCDFGPHYKTCGAVDRELIVTDLFLVRHDKCPLCEIVIGVDLANGEDMSVGVPDCNDCGYLNYTEKQQQAYGANSYMKDHRCNCYNIPVYHRASFRNHDPYIYPCDECREDNFVNYFDCESSKCNKKGEQNDN